MTRLAKEIPTDPAHPINKNGTYKDKHTPLTEEQKNKKKRRKTFVAQNTIFTVVAE
jgi:hypothetical protein